MEQDPRFKELEGIDYSGAQADSVSVEFLDELVKEYQSKRAIVDAHEKEGKKLKEDKTTAENKLLAYLRQCGKKNYTVEGIGAVTVTHRTVYTLPANFEDKKKVLKHFADQGEDVYLSYVGVNSQTLNKYCKQRFEEDPSFHLDGLDLPTSIEKLQFRKIKK